MPYLSVLLPARDAHDTVTQAVRSTLRHLPKDAELVVLDDGSIDSTLAKVTAISDKRLRVLEGKGSGSLGAALNRLLAESDSEIVARMDADDVTLPGRFASSLRAMRQGSDFTFTSALTMKGLPRILPAVPLPIASVAFPFHLLLSNPVRHPAMTARREAVAALGGYRALPSEDYDLWLRAALHGCAMTKTSTYGIVYRIHGQQITAGEEWRHQSRSDTETQRVFGDLSQRLLGRRFPRLVSLEGQPTSAVTETSRAFTDAFTQAISALPRLQRSYLNAKLRRRFVELEQTLTSAPPGGCPHE